MQASQTKGTKGCACPRHSEVVYLGQREANMVIRVTGQKNQVLETRKG